jgi:glycosyltransferase involved in cell wall biosynthesis
MKRRALVSAQWIPEFDRNRGAQRVDAMIRFLVDAGWSVEFLSERHEGDDWHADRLRQMGVATFVGYEQAENVVRAGRFDLALLAFWQPAERLLPILRRLSPGTRVVLDTIDLHFLRDARRNFGVGVELDSRYGESVVREFNTYFATDLLLATSAKEEEWLNDIIGPGRAKWLAMEEPVTGPPPPLEGRRGILFVGYFRHHPNVEAVEYLCHDILPLLDPALLALHPLTVIGSGLDDKIRAYAKGVDNVHMIGWVPSVFPYFAKARVCAFPLLHGAGVKGKVLQAFMMGTPVVTTHIGVEGLGVTPEADVVVAETARGSAAAISTLLSDDDEWLRLSEAGRDYVLSSHDEARVRDDFLSIVEDVMSRSVTRQRVSGALRLRQQRQQEYRAMITAVCDGVTAHTDPGEVVLVVSKGDDDLLSLDGRISRHFPQAPDGEWAGYHPETSQDAIRLLEEQRALGARYLAFPSASFWWIHHYHEFAEHLSSLYAIVHSDDSVIVYDLHSQPQAPHDVSSSADRRVLVRGTCAHGQDRPPQALVQALGTTQTVNVTQEWFPAEKAGGNAQVPSEADWVVYVGAEVTVPPGFLDDFLAVADRLGADRAQPSHSNGPSVIPAGERLGGCVARQLPHPLPLPVLAVRRGASRDGPTVLVDVTPVVLPTRPRKGITAPGVGAAVTEVYVPGPGGVGAALRRSKTTPDRPAISVLISTFQRPALLGMCLEAFCTQTLDDSKFEVIVVDDGSVGAETSELLERYESRLPLCWVRIDHAGRSAAKNLAVLLARSDVVLFFDDDDRPDPDLLHQHVEAHRSYPQPKTAILGHTAWASELECTPLMHYLTEVDKLLFAYGNLEAGASYDWRCFWEGRISCKREMLLREGLHDQQINYSIDVELSWRLRDGLEVRYWPAARSEMMRGLNVDDFCARMEGKGRAQERVAELHPDEEIQAYTKISGSREQWEHAKDTLEDTIERARVLEERLGSGEDDGASHIVGELHRCYRSIFAACYAKGVCSSLDQRMQVWTDETTQSDVAHVEKPELSVVVPVWSRTPELADMARQTIEAVWSASQVATEVIVIDNGSPYQIELPATVHRFEENRGVATAWNTGVTLARAPVIAILNSDCVVERGWDVALMEAATTGRRIAFPYTDHGDGQGFRQPDQGGTAGWCFVLTRQLLEEIGTFDERFNPAYGEDTDYWHRAWEMGIELSPVPSARVRHTRRATAKLDPHVEWLLQGHRYKYGWKHGVDPLRAPPYYNRPIIEYHSRAQREVSRP